MEEKDRHFIFQYFFVLHSKKMSRISYCTMGFGDGAGRTQINWFRVRLMNWIPVAEIHTY